MKGRVENLNGKEFQGRSIIADKRNATQWLVVRDLNTPVSAKHLPSKSSRSAAPTTTSECSSFATGGPVCLPDSTIHPSPASTTSSAFSQVSSFFCVVTKDRSSLTCVYREEMVMACTPHYQALPRAQICRFLTSRRKATTPRPCSSRQATPFPSMDLGRVRIHLHLRTCTTRHLRVAPRPCATRPACSQCDHHHHHHHHRATMSSTRSLP